MMHRFNSLSLALFALIATQAACAGFFLFDVGTDALALGMSSLADAHILIETLAALTLILGILVESGLLLQVLRRKAHLERQASLAASAFQDVIEDQLSQWGLTSAETDVARFTIKGASIAEIAGYRSSAEGTIKSHLNAIYRKADVANRGELLSLLIDNMMGRTPR